MANLILNGSTSGSVTLSSPAVSGTTTLTLPTTSGTIVTSASSLTASQMPAGSVLQVLQVKKTDVFSTASATLVDVTGLTLTITPSSASNKILFMASVAGICTDNGVVQASRSGTIIAAGDAAGSRTRSFTGSLYNAIFGAPTLMTASINWLDTPNTTSAVTYKIQAGAVGGGTLILGRNNTDNNDAQHTRAPQVITLMEIKG
jgi:hypothetical protein